jgi:divinyl protochlorophyllide a 8-vinyl-reductase
MSAATLAGGTPLHRVGPNAVLQVAAALTAQDGAPAAARLFAAAGLDAMWHAPPSDMIDQADAARLHQALRQHLEPAHAALVAADAGRRTADYLLANRIPKAAQLVLRALPAGLATRLLLQAISRNAWTFAGSGQVTVQAGNPASITIAANPLATAPCDWHIAVFQRLFRALVHSNCTVRETACCGDGAPACRFEIAIPGKGSA